MPEMNEDPRFSSAGLRVENRADLNREIIARTTTGTCAQWIERLNAAGVPCGPILSMDTAFENEQVKHLAMTRRVRHPQRGDIDIMAPALVFNDAQQPPVHAAPETGAHSEEILDWLGLDANTRERLRAAGVV